jgi:tetratricopeptide (TPR) repeat protein
VISGDRGPHAAETPPNSPAAWRDLALAARQSGDRSGAIGYWKRALDLEPFDATFAAEMSNDLIALGRLDEAQAVCQRLAQEHALDSQGWRGLAVNARRRGDRARSLDHWRRALDLEPGSAVLAAEICNDLIALGRVEDAETVARSLSQAQPESPYGWRGLALVARRRGDRARSLDHWRRALGRAPGDAEFAAEVSNDLIELGRLEEAEVVCRTLSEQFPGSPHGWRGLAVIARRRGDRPRSLVCWRKARELAPGDSGLAAEVANDLMQLGRLDEAEGVCRSLATDQPGTPHGWRGLALIARHRGDRAGALDHWRKALAADPANVGFVAEIASDLRELGRLDEAEAATRDFAAAHPASAQALILHANGLRRRASRSEILDLLQQAAALDPESPGPSMSLAAEFVSCGRLEDAEALYDRALRRDAAFAPALAGKGHLLRRRGDRRGAMRCFARLAELNRDEEGPIAELARDLIDTGWAEEGLSLLSRAVARRPAWRNCWLLLGEAARHVGERELAKSYFQSADQVGPVKDRAWLELAVEDFRDGQTARAMARLRQIWSQRPAFTPTLETLADFARTVDDLEGALECLERARAIDGSQPHLWLRIAHLQAMLGRWDEMDAIFGEMAARFGDLPDAAVMKATILRERGDYSSALEGLEQAAAAFPSHFGVWSALFAAYVEAGRFSEAEQMVVTCPAVSVREQGVALARRAQWALAQWRVEEAADLFGSALSFLPAETWLNNEAAICALLRVDLDTARTRLGAATQFDTHHRVHRGGGRKPIQTHLGQLFDEYRSDAEALIRLSADRLAPHSASHLAQLVAEAPDYTPAAIGLIVALRRKGLLDQPSSVDRPPPLIPRRIAQFWDRAMPTDVQALCATWRAFHPDFDYALFSQDSAKRYLAQKGAHHVLSAFDRAVEPAMKADLFRLAYLFFEGGYYLDADDRCTARLEGLDAEGYELVVYQENLGTIGNNFLGVIPGHPAMAAAMDGAAAAIHRGDADLLWLATGPGLVTRAVARYLAEDIPARLAKVRVLERHELARCVAIHCMTSYKYSQKHWSRGSFNKRGQPKCSVREVLDSGRGASGSI